MTETAKQNGNFVEKVFVPIFVALIAALSPFLISKCNEASKIEVTSTDNLNKKDSIQLNAMNSNDSLLKSEGFLSISKKSIDFIKKIDYLDSAILMYKECFECYYEKGLIHAKQLDFEKAIANYDTAIIISKISSKNIRQHMVAKYFQVRSYSKIRKAESEISINLKQEILWDAIADASQAIQIIEKYAEKNVESGFSYYNKALAFEKLKMFNEALEFYNKAEYCFPDNSENTKARKRVIKKLNDK